MNFTFMEAYDVVSVPELVDLGSKCAFFPPIWQTESNALNQPIHNGSN